MWGHQHSNKGRGRGISFDIQAIRKRISFAVSKYENLQPGQEDEATKAIFGPIEQIARASNEVE